MCRTVVSAHFFVSADFPVRLSFIPSRVLAQVAVFFGAGEVLGGTPAPPQRVEWHFAAQVLWVKPHLRQEEEGLVPRTGDTCAMEMCHLRQARHLKLRRRRPRAAWLQVHRLDLGPRFPGFIVPIVPSSGPQATAGPQNGVCERHRCSYGCRKRDDRRIYPMFSSLWVLEMGR